MSNTKTFIFVVQNIENDELYAGHQADIDNAIKEYEEINEDLPFKVIGKIGEPAGPNSLPLDFNEKLIQWYDEQPHEPKFIKRAVLAITNFIN
jgi:hypothetical protein